MRAIRMVTDTPLQKLVQLRMLVGLAVLWAFAAGGRARARVADLDDTGLSSPEKAALTVLGIALAGIVATAAYTYVSGKVALFQ